VANFGLFYGCLVMSTTSTNSDKPTIELILGCDPKIHLTVIEGTNGNLTFKFTNLDTGEAVTDIDAFFFNFTDPSVLGSIGTYAPDATSAEYIDDGMNTLTDGTQLIGDYDGRIEFGSGDTGVEGETTGTTGFTIWADRPLTLEDLDLESFSVVVNSEGDDGQVLTYNDEADAQDELQEFLHPGWRVTPEGDWYYVGDNEEEDEDCQDHFLVEGDVNVGVSMIELDDGSIQVTLDVLSDTGEIGDLRGLFFSLNDDSLTDGLTITGADVTNTQTDANSVTNLGSGTNMNGAVVHEAGKFDAAVEFGTEGMSDDDIRTTTFIISHDSEALTLEDFAGQPVGIRLTSVGEEDGDREASLKLLGYANFEGGEDECCDAQYSLGDVIPLTEASEEPIIEDEFAEDPMFDDLMIA